MYAQTLHAIGLFRKIIGTEDTFAKGEVLKQGPEITVGILKLQGGEAEGYPALPAVLRLEFEDGIVGVVCVAHTLPALAAGEGEFVVLKPFGSVWVDGRSRGLDGNAVAFAQGIGLGALALLHEVQECVRKGKGHKASGPGPVGAYAAADKGRQMLGGKSRDKALFPEKSLHCLFGRQKGCLGQDLALPQALQGACSRIGDGLLQKAQGA